MIFIRNNHYNITSLGKFFGLKIQLRFVSLNPDNYTKLDHYAADSWHKVQDKAVETIEAISDLPEPPLEYERARVIYLKETAEDPESKQEIKGRIGTLKQEEDTIGEQATLIHNAKDKVLHEYPQMAPQVNAIAAEWEKAKIERYAESRIILQAEMDDIRDGYTDNVPSDAGEASTSSSAGEAVPSSSAGEADPSSSTGEADTSSGLGDSLGGDLF
jgi:hypothetical protein